MSSLNNQQELLYQVAMGDEKAFYVIFTTYWPQVYGTCLRLTKNPEKAKDLAQDAFIKIWENREKLGSVKHLEGYIYMLSRNLVLDFLRKKVFDTENIDYLIHYFQDNTPNPQQQLEYRELEDVLNRAINVLPGKVGEVFRLSRVEGLTHEQIAQQLNISVVTSKTYIVRALQEVRKYVATHSDVPALLVASIIIGYKF